MKIIMYFALLVTISGSAGAQQITQISPPKIALHAGSFANKSFGLFVGDSATVQLNILSYSSGTIAQTQRNLSVPCSKSHTFYGVSFYDTVHALAAVIVGDSGLIYMTTNRGTSWIQSGNGLTGQTLRGITYLTDGALVIVGDAGIILRSADSGNSWKSVASSTLRNIYAVSINTSGHGYFVGEHGLIGRTTDFGASWPLVTDTVALGYAASDPVTLRAVAVSNADSAVAAGDSGAVGMTRDGAMWKKLPTTDYPFFNAPLPDSVIERISYRAVRWDSSYKNSLGPEEELELYSESDVWGIIFSGDSVDLGPGSQPGDPDGGSQNTVLRYESDVSKPSDQILFALCGPYEAYSIGVPYYGFSQDGSYQNILFASIDNAGDGFATAINGNLFRTTDNGLSWTPNSYYVNQYGTDVTDIHTIDKDHAFAVGWAGAVFRTSDGGVSWDSSNVAAAQQERLHSIANPADSTYVVCGDFGTIIRSLDNAFTWKASTVPTTNYLESIGFSSSQVGVAVGESGTIIRTTDQGVTWTNINNQFTGSDVSYRYIAAFSNGTYYATTDRAGLWRSIDAGQNWSQVPDVPSTISEGFYNENIGVVAEAAWSSGIVNDTMRFAFTRDGFATKPIEWTMPIVSNNRMVFHFLDSNTFLCLGSDGFVVKVDMSPGGASVSQLSSTQIPPVQAFPNPSTSHSTTIAYNLGTSGPTTIELWNALGEKVQTLLSENEAAGHHAEQLHINPALRGSFFIKVIHGVESQTLPIVVE